MCAKELHVDVRKVRKYVLQELRALRPIDVQMATICASCREMAPHSIWSEVDAVDWKKGLSQFAKWFPKPFELEPPGSLKALWIGLFNPVGLLRRTNTDCYVAGTSRFIDAGVDWACNPSWFPNGRYCNSKALKPLNRFEMRTKDAGYIGLEQAISEAFVAFAWAHAIQIIGPARLLGVNSSLGLGFGWDSGDNLVLGKLVPDGLVLADDLEALYKKT